MWPWLPITKIQLSLSLSLSMENHFWPWLLFFLIFLQYCPSHSQSPQASGDRFVYNGFRNLTNNTDLTLVRYASIRPDGILQLTNLSVRAVGRAFHPKPIRFTNSTSFSTTFVFSVQQKFASEVLGGMGFAFALAPDPFLAGQPTEFLGLVNMSNDGNATNRFFAVEFDPFKDMNLNDFDDNHVGIDLNSVVSTFNATAGYYLPDGVTKKELSLQNGTDVVVWIDYDGAARQINVTLAPLAVAKVSKPTRPLISYSPLDIAPIVGNTTYVGFSASTGGLLQSSHYIQGWSFSLNGPASALDYDKLPFLPIPPPGKSRFRAVAIGTSVASAVLLVVAVVAGIWVYRKMEEEDPIESWEEEYGPHRFPYKEIVRATKGFGEKQLLGSGGFGQVYHGTLAESKTEVAVKRVAHGSKQGLKEFVAEVSSMGRLRHRNLVQLQGWCRRRGDLLLVYDYMPNGSLDQYLFRKEDGQKAPLNWAQRYRILRGVASALTYLHQGWEKVVLHRDIKSSNVLLDAEMNGKLGDFGLARLYEHGSNPTTTRVVGTVGYLAPELSRTGKATTRSDVFAFGTVLLEVGCGRRPIEAKRGPEELLLVDWVWACALMGRILDAMDPLLHGDFEPKEAELVLKLGLLCSHPDPEARPTMWQVMQYLDGDAMLPDLLSDVPPPTEYKIQMAGGFEDFVHSYPSSANRTPSGSQPSEP